VIRGLAFAIPVLTASMRHSREPTVFRWWFWVAAGKNPLRWGSRRKDGHREVTELRKEL
jgi:hypothetical protein